MNLKLNETVIQTIRSAARKLTGASRRAFQAEVARDYCDASSRATERIFGWSRLAVEKGLIEQKTGQVIFNQPGAGRTSSFQQSPHLHDDIKSLVDPNSQPLPSFENTFRYTRMTAKAVLEALVREKGYKKDELPAESTMRALLNQMNYRLRRVQKTKVKKKSPKPMRSSQTSKPLTQKVTPIRKS